MKKKKFSIFRILFYVLFLSYVVLFVSSSTGYYEYKNHKRTVLTEEQIKKFESDIKAGIAIDMNNYVVKDEYSYKNKLSVIAIKLSDKISNIVTGSVKHTFKFMSKLLDE